MDVWELGEALDPAAAAFLPSAPTSNCTNYLYSCYFWCFSIFSARSGKCTYSAFLKALENQLVGRYLYPISTATHGIWVGTLTVVRRRPYVWTEIQLQNCGTHFVADCTYCRIKNVSKRKEKGKTAPERLPPLPLGCIWAQRFSGKIKKKCYIGHIAPASSINARYAPSAGVRVSFHTSMLPSLFPGELPIKPFVFFNMKSKEVSC